MTRRKVTLLAVVLGAAVAIGGVYFLAAKPGSAEVRAVSVVSASLMPDGRTLRVTFLAGSRGSSCGAPGDVRVVRADRESVRVRAEVRYDLLGKKSSTCPLVAREASAVVVLDTPLDGRTIIDDKSGKPIGLQAPPTPGETVSQPPLVE